MTSIAVLIASTSNNSGWQSANDVSFISCTIPSIVSLSSDGFRYKFFIGYDHDDQFFLDSHSELERILESMSIDFDLTAIDNVAHKPCPVWNSLFKVAYDEGFDYFFQVGDDVKLFSQFDVDFTSYLESLDNVGVIGPMSKHCPPVITQAFFHRKHMDVFGFLYPPELPDWNSDTWLTFIYKRFKRSKVSGLHEVKNTRVANHGKNNRYEISSDHKEKLHKCLNLCAPVLEKYIKKEVFHNPPQKETFNKSDRA